MAWQEKQGNRLPFSEERSALCRMIIQPSYKFDSNGANIQGWYETAGLKEADCNNVVLCF